MRTVDVVIPTLGHPHIARSLATLRHIPWPIRLILVPEGHSWWEAVNIGFSEVDKNDVILMDDDIFLRSSTFDYIDKHYDDADIFGFKLLYPDGRTIQHAGGVIFNGTITHRGIGHSKDNHNELDYCCHVTTSLTYIKNSALRTLGGMATDYPGMQYEDVDWSFRAINKGLKLLYTPGEAIHIETASKKTIPGYAGRFKENYDELSRRWLSDKKFMDLAGSYPVPLKAVVR